MATPNIEPGSTRVAKRAAVAGQLEVRERTAHMEPRQFLSPLLHFAKLAEKFKP
jgi:hypothetical protein